MAQPEHEHTLNVWIAGLLRELYGLDARQEQKQAGGGRIDVAIRIGPVKIALEAEQGQNAAKRREAIRDADTKLKRKNADCAIAVCYPDGISSEKQIYKSRMLWTIRDPKNLVPAAKARWSSADLSELASIIKLAPMQLGNPDLAAAALAASLDRAVGRLSESQKVEIARALDLPRGKATRLAGQTSSRWNQAAKRALLVVATAMMFHSRLDSHRHELRPEFDGRQPEGTPFTDAWPPMMAQQCVKDADPIGAFDRAWDLWLAVDYKPIFATAQSALNGCPHDSAFTAAIQEIGEAALALTRDISGLRHDLLGRIFHTVLDTARYDGSYYTTTAAATLLASLAITEEMCDWTDSEAVTELRITDPACGTGTLLMAAAERIHDLSSGSRDDSVMAQALIEQVLSGYDVNLTATHMAATTLGLLSPTTRFQNMKIGRAFLGVDNSGDAYLGSLEFLDQQPKMMAWPDEAQAVSQIDTGEHMTQADPADLVIMNPPFTRDSLRHDQFSKSHEAKLKARERRLFANKPTYMAGGSGAFLFLGEYLNKPRSGAIAAVLPLVGATDASGLEIRKFLASRYHVETIITSHDPRHIYFSENTNIGEMLVICRRINPEGRRKNPMRIVNLAINPSTPAESIALAQAIDNGTVESQGYGTVQRWPASKIGAGNWGGVQFLSPYLCKRFSELSLGEMFSAISLGEVARVGPGGQRIRDAYTRTTMPDSKGRTALWFHDTTVTQRMAAQPDSHIVAKSSKAHLADRYWDQRSRLLLTTRVNLPTIRTPIVRADRAVVGSSWVPCNIDVSSTDLPAWEKALCIFLTPSVGILSILGHRTNRKPTYPSLSLDDLRKLTVPNFEALAAEVVSGLATTFDNCASKTLLPLPQMDSDPVRRDLDDAVCTALGVESELVSSIRNQLAAEPSVTGRRYGS